MTYINSVSASSSTYSVDRRSDVKAGIIKLNRVSIIVNAGDTLQSICNKINAKRACHGVNAKIETVHGRKVISLSSPRQIDILDRNNILNNIGLRIRANLARNDLISGLVLTHLANISKVSCRHIFNPYQICEAPINNLPVAPAIREEINDVVDSHISIHDDVSKFDDRPIILSSGDDSINNFTSSRSSNNIPNIINQEEREESKEPEKIELFKNIKDPIIQDKSNRPVPKKKPYSFDPYKKNVKDPIVYEKRPYSVSEYKTLSKAVQVEVYKYSKNGLRDKIVSVQDERTKYNENMLKMPAEDIIQLYFEASPLKVKPRKFTY